MDGEPETGTIDLKSSSSVDLTDQIHQLPCCIKYTGPSPVSHYFKPKPTGVEVDGLNAKEAHFRGRKLQGTTVTLPDGYSGCLQLKAGGAIPAKGKKVTLVVKNVEDLSRDVIKSDTASVTIPEIDLELAGGTLGGLVTTVEGLVTKISENSLEEDRRSRWLDFRARLTKLLNREEPWTLILDDALANSFIAPATNSFIAPATDDIKDDHQLTFEEYERSWEQNVELGLNDMDTSSADAAYAMVDAAS